MFRNDIQYSSVIGCQSGNTQDNVPVEMRLARQLSVLGNVKPVNTPPSGSGYRTGSSPFDLPTSVCQPGRPNVSVQAGNGGSSYRITRLANYGRPSTRFVRRSTFETSLATSQGDASIHTRLPRELLASALPPRGQSSEAFAQTNSVNTCIPMAVLMAYKVTCVAKRNDLRRMLKQFSMGQYFSPYPKNWNTRSLVQL
uniref:Uncharacterized protein n=1 Tax=Trichuris muris TaxID=70415 RepID=A0A5S6Q7M9_TRIMR